MFFKKNLFSKNLFFKLELEKKLILKKIYLKKFNYHFLLNIPKIPPAVDIPIPIPLAAGCGIRPIILPAVGNILLPIFLIPDQSRLKNPYFFFF